MDMRVDAASDRLGRPGEGPHGASGPGEVTGRGQVVDLGGLRVLYVTDREDAPYRYRCVHGCLQLREAGVAANVARLHDGDLLDRLPSYSLVVLFRLGWSSRVAQVAERARSAGARVAYEVDDLIFDPAAEALMPFLERLAPDGREEYRTIFEAQRRTLLASDLCIGATEAIARHARALGRPAVVHPNLLSREYLRLSRAVHPARPLLLRRPTIGYLSGSNTHDGDLESIARPLVSFLRRRPDASLMVCGFLELPSALRPVSGRIERFPFQPRAVYPWLMARCHGVLAPLERINDFTNAKSALKVFEAGVFGVPAIASPSEAYLAAVRDGSSGFIARTEEEWQDALLRLLEPGRSARMGASARAVALADHSPDAFSGTLARKLAGYAGRLRGGPPARTAIDAEPRRATVRRLREEAEQSLRIAAGRAAPMPSRIEPAADELPADAPIVRQLGAIPRRGRELVAGGEVVGAVLVDREHPASSLPRMDDLVARSQGSSGLPAAGSHLLLDPAPWPKRGRDELTLVLQIRVRCAPGDGQFRLYWRGPGDDGFADERSVRFPVVTDGILRTYVAALDPDTGLPPPALAALRIDLPGAAGEAEVPLLAVVTAPALPPVGAGGLRVALGRRFLRGAGVEIGALQNPMPVPEYAHVRYIDRFSLAEAREHCPELDGQRLVEPAILAEAHQLTPVASGSQDFVICNHVLEHVRDPILALREWLRVLRPGGHLFLSAADRRDAPDDAILDRLLPQAAPGNDMEIVERQRDGEGETGEHIAVLRKRAPSQLVDVVIPVYNAREYTRRCVESVLAHATGDWRLVLVDDASTEPGLAADLAGFARAEPRIVLLANERNQGFVATANRGMRAAAGRDVLLLNSDTEVFAGFLDRFREAAHADRATGILSPFSNNATICSIPEFARDNPIPDGYTPERFAGLVSACSRRSRPELVTAVGFCMYVKAEVFERLGYFDEETFGRGYGEENDLCERAKKAGYTIRLCDDVFVYHKGKASFGTEGLATENQGAAARLEAKQPGYHAAVASFVQWNPLAPLQENIRFHLRRLAGDARGAILFTLHDPPFARLPGGTEFHVRDLIRAMRLPRAVILYADRGGIGAAEILDGRVDEPLAYHFPVVPQPGLDHPDALRLTVRRLLEVFQIRAAHIHHLMRWPLDLGALLEEAGIPYAVTHHDFYALCPNWNLFDHSRLEPCRCAGDGGAEEGVCIAAFFRSQGSAPPGDPLSVRRRHRAACAETVKRASANLFPSAATRATFEQRAGFPIPQPRVIEHGHDVVLRASRPRKGTKLRLAVVGNVCPIKGEHHYLDVLARTRDLPVEWHFFGDSSSPSFRRKLRAIRPGGRLVLHGPFARDEISDLLAAKGIDLCVILPAVDETFGFVLSEALVAGVPAIAAPRGALAERIARHGAGKTVDGAAEAAQVIAALCKDRSELEAWTERARGFRHRTMADDARDHLALYAELGWMLPRDAPPPSPEWLRELDAARARAEAHTADRLDSIVGWEAALDVVHRVRPFIPSSVRRIGKRVIRFVARR
jgi:GT2 family glycosyltransferase/glycosyltransferase involved in cell wall biosynthesis